MEVNELLKRIKEEQLSAEGSYSMSQWTDILATEHSEKMWKLYDEIEGFIWEWNIDLPF